MAELAMFPLETVLFRTMVLPLHVFEERYRALVRDVVDGERQFGVVLIERGSEVGGGDQRANLGTVAQILEVQELDDGRFALVTIGSQRIAITRWLDDDPYPRAEVEAVLEREGAADTAHLVLEVQRHLRRVAAMRAELGRPAPPVTIELSEDPVVAGYQAAALAGLNPADAQRLLRIDDPSARLTALATLLEDQAELLHAMLAQAET